MHCPAASAGKSRGPIPEVLAAREKRSKADSIETITCSASPMAGRADSSVTVDGEMLAVIDAFENRMRLSNESLMFYVQQFKKALRATLDGKLPNQDVTSLFTQENKGSTF